VVFKKASGLLNSADCYTLRTPSVFGIKLAKLSASIRISKKKRSYHLIQAMSKVESVLTISIAFAILFLLFFILAILLIISRFCFRLEETTHEDTTLEDLDASTERISLEHIYSTQHYQAILDLPTSIYPDQTDAKSEQEVCGLCLFPVEPGDTIKTIPACKHFFHGLHCGFNCYSRLCCQDYL
jgi:hypothetical protein